jgi:hypothetical protein
LFLAGTAAAHDTPYALARLSVTPAGEWRLSVSCHIAALVLGAPQGHLQPEAQAALDALPDPEVEARARLMADYMRRATIIAVDGRRVATPPVAFPTVAEIREDGRQTLATAKPSAPFVLSGRLPPGARRLVVALPPDVGITLLRVDGGASQALSPAQPSAEIAVSGPQPGSGRTVGQYLTLGFTHILPKGLDHILFVLSLFLLAPRLTPLTWQVTGFTLAHSVTLSLAVFGLVALPPRIVEVAIAVSIAVMALDNLRSSEMAPWRPAVVFGFGLLHGLGFANVLRDLGLPRGQEAAALISFNLGIEGGQLAVLGLAFAGLGWTIPRPWYRARVAVPASAAIAAVATIWALQRAFT